MDGNVECFGRRRDRFRGLLLAFAASTLCACASRPPALGLGLRVGIDDNPGFAQRVRLRFPVGSDEQLLLAELRREKFRIAAVDDPSTPHRFLAGYEVGQLVCRDRWVVSWRAEEGRIEDITGSSRETCL
jgi:hypothetical protein